ncbi:hypothetical protein A2U01_0014714 [Trifolium medium]|uniref:Uncharacterized protein n=1 Tax=Trifolium medium TaxID=97028 RepID=A0A392N204_9FABA|nr:hypothetical protein [Trifolium medium]
MFDHLLISDVSFIQSIAEAKNRNRNVMFAISEKSFLVKEDLKMLETNLEIYSEEDAALDKEITESEKNLNNLKKRKRETQWNIHEGLSRISEKRRILKILDTKKRKLMTKMMKIYEDEELADRKEAHMSIVWDKIKAFSHLV